MTTFNVKSGLGFAVALLLSAGAQAVTYTDNQVQNGIGTGVKWQNTAQITCATSTSTPRYGFGVATTYFAPTTASSPLGEWQAIGRFYVGTLNSSVQVGPVQYSSITKTIAAKVTSPTSILNATNPYFSMQNTGTRKEGGYIYQIVTAGYATSTYPGKCS